MSDQQHQNPEEREQRSSVKIVLNAKREAQVEVKVYAGDSQQDVDRVRTLAVAAYRQTLNDLGIGAAA